MPKIALIGSGPAGIGFLNNLLEQLESENLTTKQKWGLRNSEIHIFEKSLLMGAGLPYDQSMTDPEHLLNIPTNTSYINRFTPGFHEWASTNQEVIKNRFKQIYDQRLADKIKKFPDKEPELREHYRKMWHSVETRYLDLGKGLAFHPRIIYGAYQMEIFEAAFIKLREKGITIILHPGTEATSLSENADKSLNLGFEQEGVATKPIRCDQVVIASGKWHNPGRIKSNRYLAEIWPAEKMREKLSQVIEEETDKENEAIKIAVEGASLTAVDAVKTIFCDGRFEEIEDEEETKENLEEESKSQKNKKLKFAPFSFSSLITVDMMSREGIFRGVNAENRGYLKMANLPENCRITQEMINNLPRDENDKIHLWQVADLVISTMENSYRFFKEEEKAQKAAEIKNFIIENKNNYAAIAERLFSMRNNNSFQQLEEDIKMAENGDVVDGYLVWQELLYRLEDSTSYVNHLPDEEKIFRNNMNTFWSIFSAPMPLESAKEMLALHKAGVLDIMAIGHEAAATIKENGKVSFGNREYDLVINAAGLGAKLEENPSPLYKSMCENQLVLPARMQFFCREDDFEQKKKEIMEKFGDEYGERIMSRLVPDEEGQIFYRQGEMNLQNMRAIDENENFLNPNLIIAPQTTGISSAMRGGAGAAKICL